MGHFFCSFRRHSRASSLRRTSIFVSVPDCSVMSKPLPKTKASKQSDSIRNGKKAKLQCKDSFHDRWAPSLDYMMNDIMLCMPLRDFCQKNRCMKEFQFFIRLKQLKKKEATTKRWSSKQKKVEANKILAKEVNKDCLMIISDFIEKTARHKIKIEPESRREGWLEEFRGNLEDDSKMDIDGKKKMFDELRAEVWTGILSDVSNFYLTDAFIDTVYEWKGNKKGGDYRLRSEYFKAFTKSIESHSLAVEFHMGPQRVEYVQCKIDIYNGKTGKSKNGNKLKFTSNPSNPKPVQEVNTGGIITSLLL